MRLLKRIRRSCWLIGRRWGPDEGDLDEGRTRACNILGRVRLRGEGSVLRRGGG